MNWTRTTIQFRAISIYQYDMECLVGQTDNRWMVGFSRRARPEEEQKLWRWCRENINQNRWFPVTFGISFVYESDAMLCYLAFS